MPQRTVHAAYDDMTLEERRVQALKGEEIAKSAKYIKGPAVRYRHPVYLRYLLMGLMAHHKVEMLRDALRHMTLEGEARRDFINLVDPTGDVLRRTQNGSTNRGDPAQVSLLAAAVRMSPGDTQLRHAMLANKVTVLDMLLDEGAKTAADGLYSVYEEGPTPLMELCDKHYMQDVEPKDHRRLVRTFLGRCENRGIVFRRTGHDREHPSVYERVRAFYPYLEDLMPEVPTLDGIHADPEMVDAGPTWTYIKGADLVTVYSPYNWETHMKRPA
jgi:hypothetical protein